MPLAYYSRAATSEFWSEHWGGHTAMCSLSDSSRLDIPARCGEHAGIMCTRTQEQPAWLDT